MMRKQFIAEVTCDKCKNGATCVTVDSTKEKMCLCRRRFEGLFCEKRSKLSLIEHFVFYTIVCAAMILQKAQGLLLFFGFDYPHRV